jgi:pyruvate dehydrogenase E2 component (dihydrolipoamide acetyltransferase)
MGEVTMPRLSDTMSEGTVGRWLKKPGDTIEVGEIIAEIETDKATMELESFEKGTLQEILIPEGQTVPIGQTIAMIGDGSAVVKPTPTPTTPATAEETRAAQPTEEGGAVAEARQTQPATAAVADAGGNGSSTNIQGSDSTAAGYGTPQAAEDADAATDDEGANGRVKASPLARRIAEELGVSLNAVSGSGPGGRIIKEDVEEFAAQQKAKPTPQPSAPSAPQPKPAPTPAAPAPTSPEAAPLGRMRKAIARAMNESKPGVPHIYVTIEVDMDAAMALREQINASGATPAKVSVNDLVVKAAARALVAVPAVNTSYALTSDGQPGMVTHKAVNVSVAVALDDGLIAPVVKDADKKSVGAISAEIRDMAGRAREGKIKQNELEGATFQVTNLGMFGVTEFGSIITVPQAASLAVGTVRKTPVVRGDDIVVGQVMNLTLSADHRIVDGAVAAKYLQELKKLLEAPMGILV